jgi:hypothetical protein
MGAHRTAWHTNSEVDKYEEKLSTYLATEETDCEYFD